MPKEKKDIIIKGDCIEVLKNLPEESVDLIFADPPYNMQTDGELLRTDGSKFNGVKEQWDKFSSLREYDNFCTLWLKECKRVLKKDGSIWVIGSFQNIFRLGYIMQDLDFWILNDVIWAKPNAVPNFAGTRFQNSHETLIWCSKNKGAKYCFNYKTMKALNNDKQMKSIWNIGICIGKERIKDEKGNKVHSTQKPEQLLYNIILASTKKNDLILDPFFGTGTTGAMAKRLGRHYIGIEKEEDYIFVARERINNEKILSDEYIENTFDVKPPKFSMKELLDMGFLYEGQTLYNKEKTKQVTLSSDGNVILDGQKNSIHKISAKLLGKANNNGWNYFYCIYKEEFICIDLLRYLAKEEKTPTL
ncbi:MAG: DNA methyltransferase [Bacteroidota bacterium]|nr:DNA methyltransferase [Bacteroidota bacterium]